MSQNSEEDLDDTYVKIAREVYTEVNINKLGKELGYMAAEIFRFNQENRREVGSYKGTLAMLREWGINQRMAEKRRNLKAALQRAGLGILEERLLSADNMGQTKIDAEEAITNGMAPWNRSRIMVVGPAGVGKTSLIRRLTGQEFNPHEKSTKGAEQNIVTNNKVSSWIVVNDAKTAKDDLVQSIALYRESRSNRSGANNQLVTGGADRSVKVLPTSGNEKIATISKGITHEEITNVNSSELGITYSMWDFGGQEMYYITHPLFMSWRSLYILVIPLNLEMSERAPREEDAESAQKQLKGSAVRTHRTILDAVNFWLKSVYTHAVPDSLPNPKNEPKILLIGTFAGDNSTRISKEKVDAKVQELEKLIESKPYQKQVQFPICVIDNHFPQSSEVKTIQDRIDGLIKDSEYMKVQKPIRWRTFLTEIEDRAENTLTLTEARLTMTRLGINNNKEMDDVLKFCHDIGHLIYHQGCELIVLKPQFLNRIVSNIISVIVDKKTEKVLKNGILPIELIQAVWEEHDGDPKQLDNIIDLMIMFDLICEIPVKDVGTRRFFIPCRSSSMLHKKECHDDKGHTVEFTIDFEDFLPDGFLHRFYVRMAKWSMYKRVTTKPIFHSRQMMLHVDDLHRVVMTNETDSEECHEIKVMIYVLVPKDAPSEQKTAEVNLNENIIDDLRGILEDLKKRGTRRIEYSIGIWCPNCSDHDEKELISITSILKGNDKDDTCEDCKKPINIWRALTKGTKTSLGNTTFPQGASAAAAGEVFTSKAREGGDQEVEPDGKGYYNQEMKQAKPSEEQLDPKENYKMDIPTKGHMFILNMHINRKGSEVDAQNMAHVFGEIGFKIETHSDLTAKQLKDKLGIFVKSPRNTEMCSAVFLLMGHGNETGIECNNKQIVPFEFIMKQIHGMNSMIGKPKMIFFQCCRGKGTGKMEETDQVETDEAIAAKSDVLMAHATTYGNKAYRDRGKGTWFIQKLCEELLANAHTSDLSTMLDRVTEQVGKMGTTNKGQCVVVTKQGIRKKIYFLPKYPQPMQSPAE